ncbi:MAG: hypothetical protein K6F51_02165 [Acetatifactor sp.]|nr:hypothetical protein [Acetatifactor sp.]
MLLTNVLIEYGLVLIAAAILLLWLPRHGISIGADDLGWYLLAGLVINVLVIAAPVFVCVINPIRIWIVFGQSMRELEPWALRALSRIAVTLPILLTVPFMVRLYHLFYKDNGNWHPNMDSYVKQPEEFRLPTEFQEELKKRALYFDTLGIKGILNESVNLDSKQNRKPVYAYNAALSLDESGKLTYSSSFLEYYVECKILYVDRDLYAIIGNRGSDAVSQSFAPTDKPYCRILSERDKITTFIDGKYYSNGAIKVQKGQLEMLPGSEEFMLVNYRPSIYPLKKVERLDRDAINSFAEELQNDVLKDSISRYKQNLRP